jgi:hypothetical protein
MAFDQGIKGDPFRGDYPGSPGHEPWDEQEARIQRGITDLARRRNQPAVRHQYRRLLNERRSGQEPGPPREHAGGFAAAVAEIDSLPVDVGFDTLLAPGELLITGSSYDGRRSPDGAPGPGPSAKGYLDHIGMQAHEIECADLRGRVLRLTPRDDRPMTSQQLADVAGTLRSRGLATSLSHVTPAAGVIKGMGAPQPTSAPTGPRQFGNGSGKPAKVAIIDTGRSDQPRTDEWLQGMAGDIDPLDQFPQPGGDGYLDLAAGHGTFVAGIVRQVAPRARVTVYRAVDSDGIGTEVTVACEMIRAVKEGKAHIINLSLGFQTHDDLPPIAIQAALAVIGEWEREHDREVLIVAAAGNYGDTRPCWPAAFRQVVSVAGLAPDMRPVPWSTHGFWVTCSTIGQGVRSTYVQGNESPLLDPDPRTFGPSPWGVWSGTSFTAPQITGALARLHEEYGYPPREALDRLMAAGQPLPGYGQALKILPGG